MGDLLALSARVIDAGVADEPVNRVTEELSELGDDLAIVESFSHCVVLRTEEGLVAFDASGAKSGAAVVEAIGAWTSTPVSHLVYTHGHVDHVGGSRAFAARWGDPTVVGHANVDARFDRYELTNEWNIRINARQFGGIRQDLGLGLDSANELDPGSSPGELTRWRQFLPHGTLRPDVVIGDHGTLEVGGETIELHHARGETDDHIWAWLPGRRAIMAGDFLIWNFPNAGNPQKVQRFPIEWAAALRAMATHGPELIVPAHGLPIAGRERIAGVLDTVATTLETLVDQVLEMMNAGATLDEIVHTVHVPDDILAKPYLRPLYDEPEFVVRGVWRQYGGWWDGTPSRLKPAPDTAVGGVVAELAGGTGPLLARARTAAEAGDLRLACHLADFAGWAAPDDPEVHAARAEIYWQRRADERSLMSKGIFAAAARESEEVSRAGGDA
jgi:alkyl sulfatase BDS1-like metallo-beta-lactamase superfamily hydrolase